MDANGGWSVEQAARLLRLLSRYGLEYAEQPCASLTELAELRRAVDIPIAADESIRKAEDPLKVRAAGAADIVMVKVQPLGGVRAALRVAEACGLPVVVSSAVDTSVGLAAGVALAAALPALPYACGLATMSLLAGDVTAAPLAEDGGELPVRRPSVDEAALARWETDPAPWRQRALAAAAHLGEPKRRASVDRRRTSVAGGAPPWITARSAGREPCHDAAWPIPRRPLWRRIFAPIRQLSFVRKKFFVIMGND